MAQNNSRRAWEIIASHRATSSDDYADIDDYLNHNTPYSELVEGWSAILSDNCSSSAPQRFSDTDNVSSHGNITGYGTVDQILDEPPAVCFSLSSQQSQPPSHNLSLPPTTIETAVCQSQSSNADTLEHTEANSLLDSVNFCLSDSLADSLPQTSTTMESNISNAFNALPVSDKEPVSLGRCVQRHFVYSPYENYIFKL